MIETYWNHYATPSNNYSEVEKRIEVLDSESQVFEFFR